MDPLTHLLTGACVARTGFNRKAAYATLAMTLAAEIPDLDTLWSLDGPVAGFQHHRGITHTFVAAPVEALVVVGFVSLVHLWRKRAGEAERKSGGSRVADSMATDHQVMRPLTAAPVRWGMLYGFALLAVLSHILLDWTNNYGVRPFFPFNAHWYAGSFVFIFEPVMFAALLIGLIAPSLFALIGSEVGARKQAFSGRGWPIFAITVIVVMWGWRWMEHDDAVRLASTANYGPNAMGAEVLRVTASPYPGNPYRWHTVAETPGFYQMAEADTFKETVLTNPAQDLFYKPAETAATCAAKNGWLGRAYVDWSSWPLISDIGPSTPQEAPPGATGWTEVRFVDLRFLYDTLMMQGRTDPPISGSVYVDSAGQVEWTRFGDRVQR